MIKGYCLGYSAAWDYLDSVHGYPRFVSDKITQDVTRFKPLRRDEDSCFCELVHLVRSYNTLKQVNHPYDMDNNLILAASYFYSLSGNVELMQILNHLGHGISYSQLEEADTSPCLQKLAMTPENGIPLPSNIYPGTNTVLAFDNIDRLEGTLSGGGTTHCVNGISVQPVTYAPHCEIALAKVSKTKRRSFSAPEEPLPIYNIGKRLGPIPRKVKEVDGDQILKESQKKNLLFILACLHYAAHQQKVSSWTGFNIMVHS